MKIKFKKKKLLFELLLGLFWIALGIINLIEMEHIRWSKWGYVIIGLAYVGTFIFNITQHYLTIENGIIQKNELFSSCKKINLKDIIQITQFAGEYKLITEQTEFKINTKLIDPNSLEELYAVLKEFNLPANPLNN